MPSLPPAAAPARSPRRFRRRWRVVLAVVLVAAAALLARFVAQVRAFEARHATGPAWAFPSRVWSADIPLQPGTLAPLGWLRAQLSARGYREAYTARAPGQWAPIPGGAEIWLRGFGAVPGREAAPERVRLRIADGRIAGVRRFADAESGAPRDTSRPPSIEPLLVATLADSNGVRAHVGAAVAHPARRSSRRSIAAEDRRFRSHWALDLRATPARWPPTCAPAACARARARSRSSWRAGCSWAPSARWPASSPRCGWRSGSNACCSKDQILEMYLNSVYWGRDAYGGIAGVAEARALYFGVPVGIARRSRRPRCSWA